MVDVSSDTQCTAVMECASYPKRLRSGQVMSFFSKPPNYIFKVHHFSGTQLRFIMRHYAIHLNQNMTQMEWTELIGPSPSVRNALRRIFDVRSSHNIRQTIEQLFNVRVEINLIP